MAFDRAMDPMIPRRYRVMRAWEEIEDVATMELAPVDGDPTAFRPGQFNMIYPFGVGEAAISISGDPSDPSRLVHTTRNVGMVSAAITQLGQGDVVGIRGPFGSYWPVADQIGRDLLFVPGGLGLPPLRPAIHQALDQGDGRGSVSLVYGARSPDMMVYGDLLDEWTADPRIDVTVTADHAPSGWVGRVGPVTTGLGPALAGKDPANVSAFVCGPEIMMRFVCIALSEAGVPSDRIWISMERNMKCGIGTCGHCQWGPHFVCRDGPVFRLDQVDELLRIEEV